MTSSRTGALLGIGLLALLAVGLAVWMLQPEEREAIPEPVTHDTARADTIPTAADVEATREVSTTPTATREETLETAPWLEELWALGHAGLAACEDQDGLGLLDAMLRAAVHVTDHAPITPGSLHMSRQDNNWGGQPASFHRWFQLGPASDPMAFLSGSADDIEGDQTATLSWERVMPPWPDPSTGEAQRIDKFTLSITWDHRFDDEFDATVSLVGHKLDESGETEQRIVQSATYIAFHGNLHTFRVQGKQAIGLDDAQVTLNESQTARLRDSTLEFLQAFDRRIDRLVEQVPVR